MSRDYIECQEAVGKTVKSLKLYRTETSVTEILIEFEDGTSFTGSQETKSSIKASLIETGIGEPRVIRNYVFSGADATGTRSCSCDA